MVGIIMSHFMTPANMRHQENCKVMAYSQTHASGMQLLAPECTSFAYAHGKIRS